MIRFHPTSKDVGFLAHKSVKLNWKPREKFLISKYMTRSETDRTVVLDKVSISVNGIIVGVADRIIIDKESLEKAQIENL